MILSFLRRLIVGLCKFLLAPWRAIDRLSWWLKAPAILCLAFLFAGGILLLAVVLVYGVAARTFDLDDLGNMPQRSIVFAADGEILGRLHGENRIVVSLDQVSPFFIDALLAREDSRYFKHVGVDPVGVARATVRNLRNGRFIEGASTITMQLARNSYHIFEKNLHRKLVEVMLALRIERRCSKDEILSHYVNRIFFGSGLYGIERASQAYFGKNARNLDLSESAMLAGIIRSPNRFSPFRDYPAALRQRDQVLARMVKLGMISAEASAAAQRRNPRVLNSSRLRSVETSYAIDAVRRDLDLILSERELEDGGLKIYTSLHSGLQRAAEEALERQLVWIESQPGYRHPVRVPRPSGFPRFEDAAAGETPYLQGALIALDNRSGGILALVGGRDFRDSKFNRALIAKRQVGSIFKPIVYAAAFSKGLLPGTLIDDGPLGLGEIESSQRHWSPANSDGRNLGPQRAETGLIRSRNTMSVRVGDHAGLDTVKQLARDLGFISPIPDSPVSYIGTFEATLKEVAVAFSAMASGGVRRQPFIISRIDSFEGRNIYKASTYRAQAMPPGLAWLTTSVMEKILQPGGTAASARTLGFRLPAAGKTGTTDRYHDAWFAGYTDKITAGVWVGMDRPQTILSRGYASRLALPAWIDFMKSTEVIPGFNARPFPLTTNIRQPEVCRISGGLANSKCRRARMAYTAILPESLVPTRECPIHGGAGAAPAHESPSKKGNLFKRFRNLFKKKS